MNKDNVTKSVQRKLFELQDVEYRDFHARLMPTVEKEKIIGIRIPVLRKFAKEYAKSEDAGEFIKILPHDYYEENNLHGFLIEGIKDYEECIRALDIFLPYVDNWATCDIIAPKVFKKHLPELEHKIWEWMASGHTYTVRYGIGMLMRFYLDEAFQKEYLTRVTQVQSEEYYVKMMAAWYFATALAKQYETTLPFIEERRLEKWTHNKAIQKAIESSRITQEQKRYLRTLKIK
ncbi:MAG: DNA alkylation repair protein [Dorea sp.]|jgi:3-methyladenine DNA glycosylase AlkD|nr:DNA alkylation repair protein [Dorea sp.]